MSTDLQWLIVRNCSSFMVKRDHIKRAFSTDPLNMKNVHNIRFSGTIHKKAFMITPGPNNKGVTITHKLPKFSKKPAKSLQSVTETKFIRTTFRRIKNLARHGLYRRDLLKTGLRRASAILRSQKVFKPKKKFDKKKAK